MLDIPDGLSQRERERKSAKWERVCQSKGDGVRASMWKRVCVCEREREREREGAFKLFIISLKHTERLLYSCWYKNRVQERRRRRFPRLAVRCLGRRRRNKNPTAVRRANDRSIKKMFSDEKYFFSSTRIWSAVMAPLLLLPHWKVFNKNSNFLATVLWRSLPRALLEHFTSLKCHSTNNFY